jgi:hypothetical protein
MPAELMNTTALRTFWQRIAQNYMMIGSDVPVDVATKQPKDSFDSFESNKKVLAENASTPPIREILVKIDKTWQEYKTLVQASPNQGQTIKVVT